MIAGSIDGGEVPPTLPQVEQTGISPLQPAGNPGNENAPQAAVYIADSLKSIDGLGVGAQVAVVAMYHPNQTGNEDKPVDTQNPPGAMTEDPNPTQTRNGEEAPQNESDTKKTTAELLLEARQTERDILAGYTQKDPNGNPIGLTTEERKHLDERLGAAKAEIANLDAQLAREQLAEAWEQYNQSKGTLPLDVTNELLGAGFSQEDARQLNMEVISRILEDLRGGLGIKEASDKAAQGKQEGQNSDRINAIKKILPNLLLGMLQAMINAAVSNVEENKAQQSGQSQTTDNLHPNGDSQNPTEIDKEIPNPAENTPPATTIPVTQNTPSV